MNSSCAYSSSFMLDSGAFSAAWQGVGIDIDLYIDFIKSNSSYIDVYVNLDDLKSPEKTWENQEYMETHGLHPLPVYHVGEDIKWLKRAMEYKYFGIGGMALVSEKVRLHWFDYIFSIICPKENNYFPTHKIHGFGMTSVKMILRYPWYSVDSTSWLASAARGIVYFPHYRGGKYIYTTPPKTVRTSFLPSRAVFSSFERGERISGSKLFSINMIDKNEFYKYLEEKKFILGESVFHRENRNYELKFNERLINSCMYSDGDVLVETIVEEGVGNSYIQRRGLNILFFINLQRQLPTWPQRYIPSYPRLGLI